MVIFAGGKFLENVGNFQDTTPIFQNKIIWVLFLCGENFREEGNVAKNMKIKIKGKNYSHNAPGQGHNNT